LSPITFVQGDDGPDPILRASSEVYDCMAELAANCVGPIDCIACTFCAVIFFVPENKYLGVFKKVEA
jgi:hypothetical protein